MKICELLEVITNQSKVRIYKDNTIIYTGYVGNIQNAEQLDINAEVKRLAFVPEITHKQWKEKGLMQPFMPEQTQDYSFSDLQLMLYYDIFT